MSTKQKSFTQIFREKGITTSADKMNFFKDNPAKVLKNSNSHNYGIGDKTVRWCSSTYHSGNGIQSALRSDGAKGNCIYWSEICLAASPMSKDALNKELKSIAKEQKELTARKKKVNEKLEVLKETGVDSFSENEYKAYMTLKTIEKDDLSVIDKAKAIAKLIDG